MRLIYIILIYSFTLSPNSGITQTLNDAIRYSLSIPSSTARSSGVANVFSALGADLSVATTNPAGIAEFRKSEYTVTLGVPLVKTKTNFSGNTSSNTTVDASLDNLAVVFFYDPASFNIKSFNFAIGINKLADFNEEIFYDGISTGTIVQRFLERAEGFIPDELDNFEAGPAFDAGAIFNFDNGTSYESDFLTLEESVFRQQSIERSGSIQELFFTLATNIKNKVSLGFTLGLPIVDFTEDKTYIERDDLESVDFFDNIGFTESLSTSGVGVNMKVGFIYKITKKLRLGGAFHSPTWYFLEDQFATSVDYTFTDQTSGTQSFSGASPLSEFNYRLRSPLRVIGGIGYLYKIGELRGFISGETEYVNYGLSHFNLTADSNDPFDQFIQDDLNEEISLTLTSAFNFKIGTELAYDKLRFRLGGAILSSPFNRSAELDFDPQYNLGIGYRGNQNYVDLSYTLLGISSLYSPYRLLDSQLNQEITINQDRGRISFTYGSKF